MFYKNIYSSKLKSIRVFLNCFLIITYLTSFSSCVTTSETFYSKPDDLKSDYIEDITKIYLKDGSVIKSGEYKIEIGRESDETMYLLLWTKDTVNSVSGNGQSIINWTKKKIPAAEIKKIELENSTVNVPLSVLVVGGSIIVLGLIIFAVSGGIDFSNVKTPPIK